MAAARSLRGVRRQHDSRSTPARAKAAATGTRSKGAAKSTARPCQRSCVPPAGWSARAPASTACSRSSMMPRWSVPARYISSIVNSGLWVEESSPLRKTRASWKMRSNPSASSRFMAYSGLEWSQSGLPAPPVSGTPASGTKEVSKAWMCGSIPGAGTRHGVSTSSKPRAARWARTAPCRRARARAISIREIVTPRA